MEYIIILPITFEVIIGVLMLLLGAGYTFVANITDMIRGISWVSFFLWTFFQAGREIVYAFRERRFIWILYYYLKALLKYKKQHGCPKNYGRIGN